jgi:hypothetical protein
VEAEKTVIFFNILDFTEQKRDQNSSMKNSVPHFLDVPCLRNTKNGKLHFTE